MTAVLDGIELTADLFSGQQITEAIAALPDEYRYTEAAALNPGGYDADAIEAFAKLARTLKGPIRVGHYRGLVIQRELPLEERRASALSRLQEQAERGEIEPAYLHGRD